MAFSTGVIDTDLYYPGGYSPKCGIVKDSSGFFHIAYIKAGNPAPPDAIRYGYWDGSQWNLESLTSTLGSLYATPTAIAVDSNNYPRIVFRDEFTSTIRTYEWNGSVWNLYTVDAVDVWASRGLAIVIDSSDNSWITYGPVSSRNLLIAKGVGGSYLLNQITSPWSDPYGTDIAIDALDEKFQSCRIYSGNNVWIRVNPTDSNAPGAWPGELAANVGKTDTPTSLAIKSDGEPAVAFVNTSNQLVFVERIGGVWQSVEIAENPVTGTNPDSVSLQFDGSDNPKIAFDGNGKAKFAERSSGIWITTVDIETTAGIGIGIDYVIGSDIIIYYDTIASTLKSTLFGPPPVPIPASAVLDITIGGQRLFP